MSELSALHFAAFAVLFGIGAVIGWLLRADRCAREKITVNAGWQEQFESQQAEARRLAEQNRGLMEQINQLRASERDFTRRSRELAASLKESTDKRDELVRLGKDLRGQLEVAIRQRNELRADIRSREMKSEASANALREKDNKIFKLSRELTSWQSRVPPLVEKYRERELEMKELQYELEVARARSREIEELKGDLGRARDRIAELEAVQQPEHTRIEPIDPGTLAVGLDASNEQYNESFAADLSDLQDQVAETLPPPEAGNGRYGLDFVHGSADEAASPDGERFDLESAAISASPVDHAAALPLRDDLQRIKGVGPAIERTLNELGIFRFDQIASISEYEIDRIAAKLRGFRSRIYREDWIGQARTLHYQKLGGPPV